MNLPDHLLEDFWYWFGWLAWGPLFLRAIWLAPWRRLASSESLNVWLGMIVLLTLLWSMVAGVKPGLNYHLLGATVFTLCFGPYLAFIGLSGVLLGVTLNGAAGSFAFGLNALLLAGVGVWISQSLFRWAQSWLPKHFFVFIFINGFLAAALMSMAVGVAASILMGLAGIYSADYLLTEYLPYFLLLGFSEAWLSGMVLTLFVVYRPDWVPSFDDASYLAGK